MRSEENDQLRYAMSQWGSMIYPLVTKPIIIAHDRERLNFWYNFLPYLS